MNSRTFGIVGAALLLIGIFVPLTKSFEAGTISGIDLPSLTILGFIRNGDWDAIVFLLLLIASAILAMTKYRRLLIVTGILSLILVLYNLSLVKAHVEWEARYVVTSQPEDISYYAKNAWRSWGWFVPILGSIVLVIAGFMKNKAVETTNVELP